MHSPAPLVQLSSTAPADWCKRTILEFRMLRKRALRQTLTKLSASLGLSYRGVPEQPVPEAATERSGGREAQGMLSGAHVPYR